MTDIEEFNLIDRRIIIKMLDYDEKEIACSVLCLTSDAGAVESKRSKISRNRYNVKCASMGRVFDYGRITLCVYNSIGMRACLRIQETLRMLYSFVVTDCS
ncbi:hypothetical protein RF11_08397 [Thelohanellus kitauei]|uniref:Uncharacterized protein n=1 Tax=Thelohanellus kitauei TaxID=669202 RepID=A0A0C2JYV9_THEKT|nr:hypothetical protein RF11_08397 [Thelohanellus kitauei]